MHAFEVLDVTCLGDIFLLSFPRKAFWSHQNAIGKWRSITRAYLKYPDFDWFLHKWSLLVIRSFKWDLCCCHVCYLNCNPSPVPNYCLQTIKLLRAEEKSIMRLSTLDRSTHVLSFKFQNKHTLNIMLCFYHTFWQPVIGVCFAWLPLLGGIIDGVFFCMALLDLCLDGTNKWWWWW